MILYTSLLEELEEVRVKNPEHLTESAYDMVFTKNITAGDKIIPGTFVQVLVLKAR
ncbi:MAG: hypothetical protein WKF59_21300 [Chitinophagaceae bacterium]